jgi:hypothetical protein
VATRIEVGSEITRSVTNLEFARTGRFRRYGRLHVPPGANGREVRCSCDVCGAHLYATRAVAGGLDGVCVVCGSVHVTPVD